jgi:hypothetical protein
LIDRGAEVVDEEAHGCLGWFVNFFVGGSGHRCRED